MTVGVTYDPATQRYAAARTHRRDTEHFGTFATIDDVEAYVSRPFMVRNFGPRERGTRYYYSVTLDVEALQFSDLDALQRWLRGEFNPAIRGKRNVLGAIKEGVGTAFLRLLGADKRRYERRSALFVGG